MTYIYCKKVITDAVYQTQDEKDMMQLKLDVFLLNDRITEANYTELTGLLAAKEIIA